MLPFPNVRKLLQSAEKMLQVAYEIVQWKLI